MLNAKNLYFPIKTFSYFLFSFSVFFNERRIIKVIPAIIKYIILRIRLVIKAPAVFEFPDIITRNITKKLIKKPI